MAPTSPEPSRPCGGSRAHRHLPPSAVGSIALGFALVLALVPSATLAADAPPTIVPDVPTVLVGEGSLAVMTGSYADVDGDPVALSADLGKIEVASGDAASGT